MRTSSICVFFTLALSCSSESNSSLPKLETLSVTDIMETTAKSGGKIESDLGESISEKGVCWGLDLNPTLSNPHTSDGSGDDSYESLITGLMPDKEYHVRAFATNNIGVGYGNDIIFRTLSLSSTNQIIADHTVVDKYDDIHQFYIDEVKKMWLTYPGDSQSHSLRVGMALLESIDPRYSVSVKES